MTYIYGKKIEDLGNGYAAFMPKFDKVVRTTNAEEIVGIPRWQSAKWHLALTEGEQYKADGYEMIRVDWPVYKELERRFWEDLSGLLDDFADCDVKTDEFGLTAMVNADPKAFANRFADCVIAADELYYGTIIVDAEEPDDEEDEDFSLEF